MAKFDKLAEKMGLRPHSTTDKGGEESSNGEERKKPRANSRAAFLVNTVLVLTLLLN